MVSFTHHLKQNNFKTKAVIAKTASGGKQGAEIPQMQFPNALDWNAGAEIDECMGQDSTGIYADRHGTQNSSKHGSDG